MHFIKCSEIWGGIRFADENIKTKGLTASMYCKPFESNEGGDIYYFSVCGKDILTRIAIGDVAGHGKSVRFRFIKNYELPLGSLNIDLRNIRYPLAYPLNHPVVRSIGRDLLLLLHLIELVARLLGQTFVR